LLSESNFSLFYLLKQRKAFERVEKINFKRELISPNIESQTDFFPLYFSKFLVKNLEKSENPEDY